MDIKPYEELAVTTMTLVMTLTDEVKTEFAFYLLPITRILVQQTRQSSKCKLPHCKIPGSILSMRYRGNIRGVIKNSNNPFKNAVTIDISTKKKNISLKLSSLSIQMCGASSREDGLEAANHVISHLRKIQNILNKIHQSEDLAKQALEWVKNNTKGREIKKVEYVNDIDCNKVKLKVYVSTVDYLIVDPINECPENLDPEIITFLLSLSNDFINHNDYCKKLNFIMNIEHVMNESLNIKDIDEAMVNYNYSLGFEVDRTNLNKYIDGQNGFISRYNNALATSVTIELPYEPSLNKSIKRRKNKVPHHTFLVYKSGSVTQSGPGGDLMRDAYYLFMNTISDIQPYIKYSPYPITFNK